MLRTENISILIEKKIICQSLSLSLKASRVIGILGPNGCGKTTLLHTLAGLHPVAQGHIFLHEKKLASLDAKTIAQSIGVLFQDFTPIFTQTVGEYCLAARYPHRAYFSRENAEDEAIVAEALGAMQLSTFKHRSIQHLSGGEKKRLAIAALLAQTPNIYLLDEPTNHLDLSFQAQLIAFFYKLAHTKEKLVVMSLHDPNIAQQICDEVILHFKDGALLHGDKREVLTVENLSTLYEIPLAKISQGARSFWYSKQNLC